MLQRRCSCANNIIRAENGVRSYACRYPTRIVYPEAKLSRYTHRLLYKIESVLILIFYLLSGLGGASLVFKAIECEQA